MRKSLRNIRFITLAFIAVELILVGLFSIFYFADIFDFSKNVSPSVFLIIVLSLLALNLIYVAIIVIRISYLSQKTDLHAAEIIGNDVQEAYNFAMIGLAVTDESDIVLWTNDLFKERHLDIIGSSIFDLEPELRELKDLNNIDSVSKIVINTRSYEVKYLPEAGLWIFKDVTDFESLYVFSKQQAPVVGVLQIDNYADVIRGDEDYNDTVSRVKNEIFNYAKDFGLLLRRFKDDTYSLLCTYESFCKMKEDKFSIIDKVRQVSVHEEIPLTLSIGLAYDFPDVIKLNELSDEALDIAISRGGDQVAIRAYGQEMEFVGGQTEAQEKRNRVKIRVLADSLATLIKNSPNVFVMGHTMMDMDALGACLGVKAICDRFNIPCKVLYDYKLTESKARAAINSSFTKTELEQIVCNEKQALEQIKSNSLVVVVDVHIPNMVMFPSILDKSNKLVVIDHHRRAELFIESPVFNYINPAASSTCEIISEFIRFSSINPRIELPSTFATIMLSGIFLDSSYFKSKSTGIRTFEASTILKEYGADNSVADDLLKDDFEEHIEVYDLIKNLKTHKYGVVYAIADQEKFYDQSTIAKASNLLLSMKGIHACFVVGRTSPKESKISCRSDGTINVQLIAESLGGGGHFTSAAVSCDKSDLSVVEQMLVNAIDHYGKTNRSKVKNESEDD